MRMETETENKTNKKNDIAEALTPPASSQAVSSFVKPQREEHAPRKLREKRHFGRKKGPRERDSRSEFAQKVIDIRRVARVMAGGRRFSFSVALVLGDKNGGVGVGVGKALDTALAIEKAVRDAKKNMIRVKRTSSFSIPHEVKGKFSSSRVFMAPAPGRGLIAGSSVRNVLELAGITDVAAKLFSRSKNKINNARVAIKALKSLESR